MDAIWKKAGESTSSTAEYEHSWLTHSGFKEKTGPEQGKRRVGPDIYIEIGGEQLTSAIDGSLDLI